MSLDVVHVLTCDVCGHEEEKDFAGWMLEKEALEKGWEKYTDDEGYESHRCPRCAKKAKEAP